MYEWTLEDLYPSFESQEFKQDVEAYKALKGKFESLTLEDSIEGITQVVKLLEESTVLTGRLYNYIHLTLATDTTHETATQVEVQLAGVSADLQATYAKVSKFLGTIQTDITTDPFLAEYRYYFEEAKKDATHLLSDELEEVLAKMSISGGKAWSQLFDFMWSSAQGEYKGEVVTLSEIRGKAYDSDAEVRKSAYEAELKMYDAIKEPIAFSLNHIKKEVLTTSQLRGYESPLAHTLEASRMSRETLDALLEAIREYLPNFRKYLRHKAALLGHENGLPFYDLFAPVGNSSRTFTVEESKDYLIENFKTFSADLAEMTEEFFDKHYIDFYPRKGKVGGAFCANLPMIKQSRVLTNFTGSLSDVVTLAHELGHAYHGLHIENHRPLNQDYSMPVAETASTFNENIIMNTAIKEASDEEKIALIESQLQDTTQIIVDIYSRYLFESAVFENREQSFMFSKDLEEMMLSAQKEAYGDGLDQDYLHPYMWACKPHYYSTGLSFYNFPYAFGGLFSKGLYAIYQEQPEGFVEKYQELLRATTVSSVEDTAKVLGVDVSTPEFWKKALAEVAESIEAFIALTPLNK
ncbi:M3 family oligoendopeptidase [uncultured Granulicatella sp.]|jgi:oligoendopeptidase, pepF/M3 family|uniref:M3 family oligoendopeptidase n=1 Tax=uncultured Granulicatella sp. TaxID=316089 RepID=UPI0028D76E11|nr:M3 family oligoendopeptidase [uncultured Granulicatella sp.]